MQLTSLITILTVAVAGVIASPNRPPRPPPPPPVFQAISCSSGSPFCCSPDLAGTTCSVLVGSSIGCNGVVVCCNNNAGTQICSANLNQPVIFV